MSDGRTLEQLRQHYDIEKELASRLRNSSKHERAHLYSELYDELFRRVPLHPQSTRKASATESDRVVGLQMAFLKPFLTASTTFLEVGPGDCALSREVAKQVKRVLAVDVSDEITKSASNPKNFQLILSDGCSIPVPSGSVDVAYSNQLMEHLHPDDALEQLQNIHQALAPGGVYVCITPNRLSGPHDISMHFDSVATGFHVKEYTISELSALFRKVGFSKVQPYVGAKGIYTRVPAAPLAFGEKSLSILPPALRKRVAGSQPFRAILNCRFVGIR